MRSIRFPSVEYNCELVNAPVSAVSTVETSSPVVANCPYGSPEGSVESTPSTLSHFIQMCHVVENSVANDPT